jgi:pimeloyl-ACP methyl ester carboxylesterase
MEFEERFCEVEGRRVRYLQAGAGPPLVLVHAAGDSAADWQWVLPELARTHSVYAPDLYTGQLESDPPSADVYARRIERLMTALALERAAVVGNSLGGLTALRLALAYPDRVTALVLIDTAGLGRAVHPALIMMITPAYADLSVTWCKTPLGALQRAWARAPLLFVRPGLIPPAWYSEQCRLAQQPYFLDNVLAALRTFLDSTGQREVLLDALSGLQMPTLIIWGEADLIFPVAQAREATRRLRRGQLCVIPESGHLPHVEQPAGCAEALANFLRSLH